MSFNESPWSCASMLRGRVWCFAGSLATLWPHFINPEPATIRPESRGDLLPSFHMQKNNLRAF